MKKIKEFYHNNRIYCILMGISLFCIILIAGVFVMIFVNQTNTNVYGNRLAGIENVEINSEKQKEIVDFLEEQKIVDKASINIKGKIMYITVYLNTIKVDDAQSIAIKSLDKLTEDEKNFYDINYTFTKEAQKEENNEENKESAEEKAFVMMGYKKSDKTIISWTKVNGD